MEVRKIREGFWWMGALDWDRRLFDSLIPLPDGTTYNAYLVQGSKATALADTVDPTMTGVLMAQLYKVPRLDYLVAHHAEQDHSGSIPAVLGRYPEAKVVCTPKCRGMLIDLLMVPEERFMTVEDGATIDLGGKTLRFLHTPWVHWPETMCTWLEEDKALLTCDFFGSHLAQSDLYAEDEARVLEAAKRYWAEIMMPFRTVIKGDLAKVSALPIGLIAPSHGPVYGRPALILDAYRDWVSDTPKNLAVVAYVSMHGSTEVMAKRLVAALLRRGVGVEQFNLVGADLGKLAMALVDAATIVVCTPTVLFGPHPAAAHAAFLTAALKPRARFASVVGSFGWGSKVPEQIAQTLAHLKLELLEPVYCKGYPGEADLQKLDALAEAVAAKHRALPPLAAGNR